MKITKKGFTIIEVIIVVLVLAILAYILYPSPSFKNGGGEDGKTKTGEVDDAKDKK